jgi:hypothetical protein
MALPRKDVRAAVDDEVHQRLVWCAKRAGISVAIYVEQLIQADTSNKVDLVIETYDDLARSGLARKNSEASK